MAATSTVYSVGAASAYRRSQSLGDVSARPLDLGQEEPASKGAGTFGEMVQQATENAIQTVRQADVAGQQGLTGEIGTQQVIEATLAMESTVKVTVAMRDKIVEAYQQILQMQI